MSNQSTLQAAIRAKTSTTHTFEGDWLALFAAGGVTTGSFNELQLEWINTQLSASYTSLPEAQQAYAVDQGSANWSAMVRVLMPALAGTVSPAFTTQGSLTVDP